MELIEILVLVVSFLVFLSMGVPVAWTIGIATMFTILFSMESITALTTLGQQFVVSLDSFTLLAIPFFILAGQIMNQGGIATRLIDFAKNIIGSLPGGLAHINVVAAMLFGAIAGSSVAAASAIGSILGPKMEEEGYTRQFGAAINITSASMGLVIPPSNIIIVYSLASGGASIAALFIAGYLPGILTGLFLMIVAAFWARSKNFPVGESRSMKRLVSSFFSALPSLFLLVVVIGGIVVGIFTATEAAAIAVVYTLGLGFYYKEISSRDIPEILITAVQTTAVVMLLIATSVTMSWVMSYGNLPQLISESLLSLSDNKIVILLIINVILLFVGMFMDITPAVLIFTPIFLPVAVEFGIHPVHFGIMMIVNLCIGICTPPVGTLLFVGISIAKTTIEKVVKPLLPMYAAMVIALIIITYWEGLSMWLPRLFDLV